MTKQAQGMIWIWVVPLLLFTTWLGVQGLQADMVWSDEHWTVNLVGGIDYGSSAPVDVLQRASGSPWHPPLFYLLLAGWGSLVGWSAFAMRTMTLLLGVLAVAWSYRLGRDMASPRVGLILAALVGTSSLLAIYLHELRQYSLFTLTTTIGIWAYWRFVNRPRPTNVSRFWLFAGAALQVYSHYFSFLTIAAMGLYHLVFIKRDRRWAEAIGLTLAGCATILIWVPILLQALEYTASGSRDSATLFTAGEFLPYAAYAFGNGIGQLIWFPLLLLGLLAIRTTSGRFVIWTAGIVVGLALVANAIQPVLAHVRYTISLLPLFMLIAALGVDRLWQWNRRVALTVLILWMSTSLYNVATPTYDDIVYREMFAEVFRPRLPLHELGYQLQDETFVSDAIVYYAPRHQWAVIGSLDFHLYGQPARHIMLSELAAETDDASIVQARAEDFIVGAGRVWFVVEETWEADARLDTFEAALAARGFELCRTDDSLNDLRTMLYVEHNTYCAVPEATIALFGDSVQLTSVGASQSETQLNLHTTWYTEPNVPADTYSIALHLVDEAGEIVRQIDVPLPLGEFAYHTQVFDGADLAAGEYSLYAIVYDWRTGTRLEVAAYDDNRVLISTIAWTP